MSGACGKCGAPSRCIIGRYWSSKEHPNIPLYQQAGLEPEAIERTCGACGHSWKLPIMVFVGDVALSKKELEAQIAGGGE